MQSWILHSHGPPSHHENTWASFCETIQNPRGSPTVLASPGQAVAFFNVGPHRASFCNFVSQGFTKQMTTTRYGQIRRFRILTRSLHLRVLLDNERESLVGFTTVWLVLQPWECHQCREFVDTMSWVCWSQVSSNGYEFYVTLKEKIHRTEHRIVVNVQCQWWKRKVEKCWESDNFWKKANSNYELNFNIAKFLPKQECRWQGLNPRPPDKC